GRIPPAEYEASKLGRRRLLRPGPRSRGDADAVVVERPSAHTSAATRDRWRAASEPAARATSEKRFSGAPRCWSFIGPESRWIRPPPLDAGGHSSYWFPHPRS